MWLEAAADGRGSASDCGPLTHLKGAKMHSLLPMGLEPGKSPAEGEFLFELDEQPLEETVTALGGAPLFVRAVRSLDVPGSVKRDMHLKQRERGFDEATYEESFLVLNAVGATAWRTSSGCRKILDWLRCWGMRCRVRLRR